jgi:superfamily II DNA or RNA helicase
VRKLREDQEWALDQLRTHIAAGHRRIVMQAPTGYGKTILASAVVSGAIKKSNRVLFTVPAVSLIDQTMEMFYQQGITDVGVIQAHHAMTNWDQPVQIASVQTLMKRTMPECDIVLVDEVHRWFNVYTKWLDYTTGWQCPVIGLSATPWSPSLGTYFAGPRNYADEDRKPCLIVASTIQNLIDEGRLSPFRVFASSHPDLSDVSTVAGDYHEEQLSKAMQRGTLVGDAVETWLRLGENRPTFCYAVDRAHAMHLKEKFEAAGVPCAYQDGNTKDADTRNKASGLWVDGRKTIRRKFHDGEIKVVVSVGTLTTGVDWDVRCLSICRPTKSDMLFTQIVGRGLRTAEGKADCLILDHSDNHARLGFVTSIDVSYEGLHVGKTPMHSNRKDDGIRLPKECPKCAFLRPPTTPTCPACGFTAKVVSTVEAQAGELRELKPKPKPVPVPRDLSSTVEREIFFRELKAHGIAKGYNANWAANVYREKIGSFPPAHFKWLDPAAGVSPWTQNWITSRMIAYARSKRPAPRVFPYRPPTLL